MEFRHDKYAIWSKPAISFAYFNVATAASITGAVRGTLLRGISNSIRPLYCDTDSIFCTDMAGDKDAARLGAWKEEDGGNVIAIAGKKLYALMDGDKCVKKASKGVNLSPLEISLIARGDTVETRNDAPTFKLGSKVTFDKGGIAKEPTRGFEHKFIERKIRRTGIKQQEALL